MIYVLNFLTWSVFVLYLNLVSPDTTFSRIVLFLILFTCFMSSSLLFIHKLKINLLLAFYFISLCLFQYFHLLNLINLSLAAAFFLTLFIFLK